MTDVHASLEEYREVREALEAALLRLTTSVEGRRFNFQVSLHGWSSSRAATWRSRGTARLAWASCCRSSSATRTPPPSSTWRELALARGVPFRLDAGGFGRHTFLCGQSGSGKTNSLGVLDPNSDYVRRGEPRVDDERYRYAAASVHVRRGSSGTDAVRVRFRDLSPVHQAGRVRLDPLADRAEYGELLSGRAVGAAAEGLHAEVDEARLHRDRGEAHRRGPPLSATPARGKDGSRNQRQAGTVGGPRELRGSAVRRGRLGVMQPAGGSGRRRRRLVGGSVHGRAIL